LSAHRSGDGRHVPVVVDVGAQPPLRMASSARPQIHPVNLRWLGGTVLTGVAGVALMGAAILAAMHGEALLAKAPGFAQPNFTSMLGDRISNALHKSDRITPHRTVNESRQTFRISSTTRTGDREVVHTRPVTLVSASLNTGDVAGVKFPRFNPMSLFSDSGDRNADPGPEPDGDISYMLRDLRSIPVAPEEGPHLPLSEVMARVGEAAAFAALHRVRIATPSPDAHDGVLAMAGGPHPLPSDNATPLASSGALSNMTVLIKAAATRAPVSSQPGAADDAGDKVVVARAGDTLETLLAANGVNAEEVKEILSAMTAQSVSTDLAAGDRVKILLAPHPGDASRQDAMRITLATGKDQDETSVVQSDTGGYAVVEGSVPLANAGAGADSASGR